MTRIVGIETLAMRDVCRHEAHDFTRWLNDDLEVFGGAPQCKP